MSDRTARILVTSAAALIPLLVLGLLVGLIVLTAPLWPRPHLVVSESGAPGVTATTDVSVADGDVRVGPDDTGWTVSLPGSTAITAAVRDAHGPRLVLGTSEGQLLEWPASPNVTRPSGAYRAARSAITRLIWLAGGRTLVVGTADGTVQTWHSAPTPEGPRRLIRVHDVRHARGVSVSALASAPTGRRFAVGDTAGEVLLVSATTGAVLARHQATGPVRHLEFDAEGGLTVHDGDPPRTLRLDPANAESWWSALLARIRYEGEFDRSWDWRPTADGQARWSLVPMIVGSMKGAAAALPLAMPLGILSATYCTLFLRPRLRAVVRIAMRMLGAIPGVVMGLFAIAFLAPRAGSALPAIPLVLIPLVLTVVVAGFVLRLGRPRVRRGQELLALVPIVATLLVGLDQVVPRVPVVQAWLAPLTAEPVRDRNALLTGFAMGIALVPMIFRFTEAALRSVPRRAQAASLALGATSWQTAWHVMLPAAMPGIAAAVLIGWARAIGDSMVVLLASGNRPIVDWNPAVGFRTLTASLALDGPGAQRELVAVLALSALVLVVTSASATIVASWVQDRALDDGGPR